MMGPNTRQQNSLVLLGFEGKAPNMPSSRPLLKRPWAEAKSKLRQGASLSVDLA